MKIFTNQDSWSWLQALLCNLIPRPSPVIHHLHFCILQVMKSWVGTGN